MSVKISAVDAEMPTVAGFVVANAEHWFAEEDKLTGEASAH